MLESIRRGQKWLTGILVALVLTAPIALDMWVGLSTWVGLAEPAGWWMQPAVRH